MEDKIKKRLNARGFTKEQLSNNRGLISATIEDTLIESTHKHKFYVNAEWTALSCECGKRIKPN